MKRRVAPPPPTNSSPTSVTVCNYLCTHLAARVVYHHPSEYMEDKEGFQCEALSVEKYDINTRN